MPQHYETLLLDNEFPLFWFWFTKLYENVTSQVVCLPGKSTDLPLQTFQHFYWVNPAVSLSVVIVNSQYPHNLCDKTSACNFESQTLDLNASKTANATLNVYLGAALLSEGTGRLSTYPCHCWC